MALSCVQASFRWRFRACKLKLSLISVPYTIRLLSCSSKSELGPRTSVGTHVDGATNNPNNRGRRRDRGHRRVRERKRSFWSHLYHINAIFLPRQAQDKHGENSKKSTVFLQNGAHSTSKKHTRNGPRTHLAASWSCTRTPAMMVRTWTALRTRTLRISRRIRRLWRRCIRRYC